MTLTLRLGVIDVPYTEKDGATTGDVAEILEAKYGVYEVFYENNAQAVGDALTEGFQGSLESVIMGRQMTLEQAFDPGTATIDTLFKNWLSSGAIESLGIPGVPTKASQDRKSSRFKKGKSPRTRPSFIDTGLYESSFKSTVEYTDWDQVTRAAANAFQGGR